MVAICDVDENNLNAAAASFPKAKKYYDFRKMLDEMGKSIDAVTVSTPDHCHAPAAADGDADGEARLRAEAADAHASTKPACWRNWPGRTSWPRRWATRAPPTRSLRKAAAVVKAGVVGKVERGPCLDQSAHLAARRQPPQVRRACRPTSTGTSGWARRRCGPLAPAIIPSPGAAGGTSAPAPWATWPATRSTCPSWPLGLRDPTAVQARTGGHNGDSYQKWSTIDFEFPATDARGPVKFHWYDGGKLPSPDVLSFQEAAETVPLKDLDDEHQRDAFAAGCLVIGDKGRLYAPGDYGEMGFALLDGGTEPEVDVPESPGHFQEWVRAIRGGEPAMSNFPDYAGPLTETILLGNLAVWLAAAGEGQRIEWDPKNLAVKNIPGLERLIKTEYRPGYSL